LALKELNAVFNTVVSRLFCLCRAELNRLLKYDKGKGKAVPLQAWTGAEVYRRLRFPDFKTIGT